MVFATKILKLEFEMFIENITQHRGIFEIYLKFADWLARFPDQIQFHKKDNQIRFEPKDLELAMRYCYSNKTTPFLYQKGYKWIAPEVTLPLNDGSIRGIHSKIIWTFMPKSKSLTVQKIETALFMVADAFYSMRQLVNTIQKEIDQVEKQSIQKSSSKTK